MEERYCSNCRASIPEGSEVCQSCGVYAGDIFDGRFPADRERSRKRWKHAVIMVAAIVAGTALVWFGLPLLSRQAKQEPRRASASVRVVRGRPGEKPVPAGEVGEAEAIRRLRRALTTAPHDPISDDCLVVMSKGRSGNAWILSAYNHCEQMKLGAWQVSVKNGTVTRGQE